MTHCIFSSIKITAAGTFLLCHLAAAQGTPDTVNKAANCNAAGRTLAGMSAERSPEWAWQRLYYCDRQERNRIHDLALRRVRTSTDSKLIAPAIGRVVSEGRLELFDEVLSIAGDRSATLQARVYAFMTLAVLRDPFALPRYDRFVGGLDSSGLPRGGCSGRGLTPTIAFKNGKRLTPNQARRIMDLAFRVSHDSSEPNDVRSAAACT